ncbi:hypothetical protein [Marinomonas sp. PE14-40]|uniref:hypothetical protein n=1 Tax=Marinomonas sp. PE14-40 TaxID=3060621 RepID=UPI003F666423
MHYQVTARLKPTLASELLSKLQDGTIETQKPDGKAIFIALQQAVIYDKTITWCSQCYCSEPLGHERETVFDVYFNDIEITLINQEKIYQGDSFMAYLQGHA